MSISRVNY